MACLVQLSTQVPHRIHSAFSILPFVTAALSAVRAWRYEPATADGRAIAFEHVVQIPFKLGR